MTMTLRIRTGCPTCGDVQVDPAGVTLVLNSDTGEAKREFTCSSCRLPVSETVSQATAEMLLGLGVPLTLASS